MLSANKNSYTQFHSSNPFNFYPVPRLNNLSHYSLSFLHTVPPLLWIWSLPRHSVIQSEWFPHSFNWIKINSWQQFQYLLQTTATLCLPFSLPLNSSTSYSLNVHNSVNIFHRPIIPTEQNSHRATCCLIKLLILILLPVGRNNIII